MIFVSNVIEIQIVGIFDVKGCYIKLNSKVKMINITRKYAEYECKFENIKENIQSVSYALNPLLYVFCMHIWKQNEKKKQIKWKFYLHKIKNKKNRCAKLNVKITQKPTKYI